MKVFLVCNVFLFVSLNSFSTDIKQIEEDEIPKEITIKGKIHSAYKWTDNNGINILILSSKGPLKDEKSINSSDPEFSKTIYGEQYTIQKGKLKLMWDIIDYEKQCPFDLEVDFLTNSVSITDLDNDGITETTIAYKLTCRSDISPASMKVLMHENEKKMGLRGQMMWTALPPFNSINLESFQYDLSKITQADKERVTSYQLNEGRFKNSNDFKNSPRVFFQHALNLWKDLVIEK
ncbi:M949_RS01915 family surface polysaccharide biosynthesis protein [Reichenbachiella sp.]